MPTLAQASRGIQSFDYVVVLIYLFGVLGLGLYFSRQQKRGEDYFVAGREMPWLAVGLSLMATLLSTLTYLAAPGELIQHGLALSIGWLVMPLPFLIVSLLWLPFFMRLRIPVDSIPPDRAGNAETDAGSIGVRSTAPGRKLTSVYEYLELRYGLAARWLGAALFVLVLRLGWMGLIVLTASEAIARITLESAREILTASLTQNDWTLAVLLSVGLLATVYTMLGGMKAVIWTDVVQSIALFVGAILTLVYVAIDTGTGPIDWWQTVAGTESKGHEFPPLGSWDLSERNPVLFVCLNTVFWYACTNVCDQVALQRHFSTPSLGAAIRSNAVNFLADFAIVALLAMCGMALLTYYLQFTTEIVPGITDPRDPEVADSIFPHFIANGLPVGISGFVVAALIAVAMSSLDSGMNSVSTVLTIDFARRLKPSLTAAGELQLARGLTLVIGLGCTLLAWPLIYLPSDYNIIDITSKSYNCGLGPLAGMFVVGMFLPHVGQRAIVFATLAGLFVAVGTAWWTELIYIAGLTDADTLTEALRTTKRPGPFLVTPLAATATFLIAATIGALLEPPDLQRMRSLTWRGVVFGHRLKD